MATDLAQLKHRVKFGPKMGRELRAEYLLTEIGGAERRLSPATLAKVKVELARLAASPDARVRKFVASMHSRYPGVR